MSRGSSGAYLSAVFVDYDNIYLSLKRKSEEAAKRFAKHSYKWVQAIESGELIAAKHAGDIPVQRRVVMSRCYGNPVPRRNQSDNSTDMSSFPFVRHHFLRGGFEIIDCPPLTAQLKNSADIRMVMDIRDFLTHETYFDEFVILSSDADFTPLLHRLRAHARRTIIYANDHTAAPYAALSDGDVKEGALLDLLLEDVQIEALAETAHVTSSPSPAIAASPAADTAAIRGEIVGEVVRAVLEASAPQPLEALAERAIRVLGHAKTVGTDWGGVGSFRDLLAEDLPADVKLTEQAPYFAYDVNRAIARSEPQRITAPAARTPEPAADRDAEAADTPAPQAAAGDARESDDLSPERASTLQRSIAQIHQACEAPPFSPPEYRAVFTLLANEIATNRMQGVQTIENVRAMALELGIDTKAEDVRFIIDVVGKPDPWFERDVSAAIFAGRFRNFVIAKCKAAGMQLSSDEIDLIDAWFGGNSAEPASRPASEQEAAPAAATDAGGETAAAPTLGSMHVPLGERTQRWWQETSGTGNDAMAIAGANDTGGEEFPRIVRNRFKG